MVMTLSVDTPAIAEPVMVRVQVRQEAVETRMFVTSETARDTPVVLKPVIQLFEVQLAIRAVLRFRVKSVSRAVAGRQSRLGSHRCRHVTVVRQVIGTDPMPRWQRDVVVWQWQ